MASADRKTSGNRARTIVRGVLVVLSVVIPFVFIFSAVAGGTGPLGVRVPETIGALAALALVIGISAAAVRG